MAETIIGKILKALKNPNDLALVKKEAQELAKNANRGYANIVWDVFKNKEEFEFYNTGLEHALLVTYLLIEGTEKNIQIYTRPEEAESIYGHKLIQTAMQRALKRGVKITVVIDERKKP